MFNNQLLLFQQCVIFSTCRWFTRRNIESIAQTKKATPFRTSMLSIEARNSSRYLGTTSLPTFRNYFIIFHYGWCLKRLDKKKWRPRKSTVSIEGLKRLPHSTGQFHFALLRQRGRRGWKRGSHVCLALEGIALHGPSGPKRGSSAG